MAKQKHSLIHRFIWNENIKYPKPIKLGSNEIDLLIKNYTLVFVATNEIIESQLTKGYYCIEKGRLNTLVSFSLYDFVNYNISDNNGIDKVNKFIDNKLIFWDKELPNKFYFNRANKSWNHKYYQKFLKIRNKYPELSRTFNYRYKIESKFGMDADADIGLSPGYRVYSTDGSPIRDIFKSHGLLDELEFIWSQLSNGISMKKIFKVYKPLIDNKDSIIRYPHAT